MHSLLLHNGRLVPTDEKTLSPGQVGYMNGWGIFSTMRVVDGVLFAFERHWQRMNKDAALMSVPMPVDQQAFQRDLLALVEANHAYNGTLRVAVVRNRGGLFEGTGIDRDYDVVAFTTGLHQWGEAVTLAVEENARHAASRFSGVKVTSWGQNLTWLDRARREGCDEVVLLDELGRVSECTSANIFAVTQDGVWTPPLSCGCLPGVTRAVLLEEIDVPGVKVGERALSLDELYSAREVFITSTTRGLLAVASIAGRPLARETGGGAREKLQAAFTANVAAYVVAVQRDGRAASLVSTSTHN